MLGALIGEKYTQLYDMKYAPTPIIWFYIVYLFFLHIIQRKRVFPVN